MDNIPIFRVDEILATPERFDKFIEWARPYGLAGINHLHQGGYDDTTPWFDWSSSMLEHGAQCKRTWFLKLEYLEKGREVFKRVHGGKFPEVINRCGLISSGRFLSFGKAYINVMTFYRAHRSPSNPVKLALTFLEKALRDTNSGDNDPANINRSAFVRATRLLTQSDYSQSLKYDIGQELTIMARMLQTGHHSKTFRFKGKGFYLLDKPFAFESGISQPSRKRAISKDIEDFKNYDPARMTAADVCALGVSYQKALRLYGDGSLITFIVASVSLPLTTVSMRASEVAALTRDALYIPDKDSPQRRLRIYRSKPNLHQDLPIPMQLSELSHELFERVKIYSQPAHEAFQFYVSNFGDDFSSIDELYIPKPLKEKFDQPYLTLSEVCTLLNIRPDKSNTSKWPQRFDCLDKHVFIDAPGDMVLVRKIAQLGSPLYVKLSAIENTFISEGIICSFPSNIDRNQYVNKKFARGFLPRSRRAVSLLNSIYKSEAKAAKIFIETADLKKYLLQQFKSYQFPHWPFLTKEKVTRLDNALLLFFEPDPDRNLVSTDDKGMWWCPRPVSTGTLNSWISSYQGGPPRLFEILDIKLSNGTYPSISLQQIRKHHHTQALLAGVNEIFVDEMAGRKSGRQSDAYDLRTPDEILLQSIDTFDPDRQYEVVGPVADEIAPTVRIVDRESFVFENAAPKHLTEIGGCRADWSLNPCELFGDCSRCGKMIWQKGDIIRLSKIKGYRKHALRMIEVADEKIRKGNNSSPLLRQRQQFVDSLGRYDAILAVEADASVPAGTIVTFDAAANSVSLSELHSRLRAENSAHTSGNR